jgi:uncharacterized protein YqeY
MTLSEQIENDLKNALREKNEQLVSCLRMLKSSLKNQAIEARVPQLDDLQVMAVLKRELKKRQDSANQFKAGNRDDLAAKEIQEAEIIGKYLPPAMSEAELIKIVDEVVASGLNNFGQVMKEVMTKTGAQADGQMVQRLVKNKLGL